MLTWLKNLQIKTKLLILALISIVGFFSLSTLLYLTVESIELLNEGKSEVQELHTDLLSLRRHEKDFLQREREIYISKFKQTIQHVQRDTHRLNEILLSFNIDSVSIEAFNRAMKSYKDLFFEFTKTNEQLDLKYNEGIHYDMRQAAHNAENILETIDNTIYKELKEKVSHLKYTSYFLSILISCIILFLSRFIIKNVVYDFRQKVNDQTKSLEESLKKQKQMQAELIQNEKMASLGSLVAGVSHEINTPIGIALTASTHTKKELHLLEKSYANETMSEKEFLEFLEDSKLSNESIHKNLNKAVDLIKSFKQVAVDQMSDEEREFHLKEYIDEVLLSIHNKIKKTKVSVKMNIDKKISLYSNAGAFSQIFTNLILNSIIHGFDNGTKKGTICISAHLERKRLKIVYEDNGKGLNELTKKKIFDPFYTTNRAKGGSGLGMNIVYNLVIQKLNGNIYIKDKTESGVCFVIECPIS